jgi:hypothetical protein
MIRRVEKLVVTRTIHYASALTLLRVTTRHKRGEDIAMQMEFSDIS